MSEIFINDGWLVIFTDNNGKPVTVPNATSGKVTLSHLVTPFSLTESKNVQIKITYTIEGTERTKTVDTPITALEAGKYNELTLTFKGADIVLRNKGLQSFLKSKQTLLLFVFREKMLLGTISACRVDEHGHHKSCKNSKQNRYGCFVTKRKTQPRVFIRQPYTPFPILYARPSGCSDCLLFYGADS